MWSFPFVYCVPKKSVLKYKQEVKARRTFNPSHSSFLFYVWYQRRLHRLLIKTLHTHSWAKIKHQKQFRLHYFAQGLSLEPKGFLQCLMKTIKSVTFGSLAWPLQRPRYGEPHSTVWSANYAVWSWKFKILLFANSAVQLRGSVEAKCERAGPCTSS